MSLAPVSYIGDTGGQPLMVGDAEVVIAHGGRMDVQPTQQDPVQLPLHQRQPQHAVGGVVQGHKLYGEGVRKACAGAYKVSLR